MTLPMNTPAPGETGAGVISLEESEERGETQQQSTTSSAPLNAFGKLSRENILEATSKGYAVFAHYLAEHYPHGVVKVGHHISNPFLPEQQATPSFNVYEDKHGAWRYHDFAHSTEGGDCFEFVGRFHNLDSRNDFPAILRHIAADCQLFLGKSLPSPSPALSAPDYSFTDQPFTPTDLGFWGRFGVTFETLYHYGVRSLASFTAQGRSGRSYTCTSADGPIFAYPYGAHGWKVYRPLEQKERRFRFLGLKPPDTLWGFDQLSDNTELVLLVGGEKDALVAAAHGFPAVTLNSESARLTPTMLAQLRSCARAIVSVYDADTAGREGAERLKQGYGIPLATLPNWLIEMRGKDIADFFAVRGSPEEFRSLVYRAAGINDVRAASFVPTSRNGVPNRNSTLKLATDRTDVTVGSDVTPETPMLSGGITATELSVQQFKEPEWVVPSLLPVGLAILGGRPKGGKSWLALNLAHAVATGGTFLGAFGTVCCDVSYLALEDNERRLKCRLQTMWEGDSDKASSRLRLLTSFPRFDMGGFDELHRGLAANPQLKLVIIDTLQKLRGKQRGGKDSYSGDYEEIGELQKLALNAGVAILVVHHTTKAFYPDPFDGISGTTGISGAADTLFVLARDHSSKTNVLHLRGRDVEEQSLAVRLDPATGLWSAEGDIEQVRLTEERRLVLSMLAGAGRAMGPKEIRDCTGLTYESVRQLLPRMARAGDVERIGRGLYQLPPTSVASSVRSSSSSLHLFGRDAIPAPSATSELENSNDDNTSTVALVEQAPEQDHHESDADREGGEPRLQLKQVQVRL